VKLLERRGHTPRGWELATAALVRRLVRQLRLMCLEQSLRPINRTLTHKLSTGQVDLTPVNHRNN